MPVGQMHRRREHKICSGFSERIERPGDAEADELLGSFADHRLDAALGCVGIAAAGGDRHEVETAQEPRFAGQAGDDGDGLHAHLDPVQHLAGIALLQVAIARQRPEREERRIGRDSGDRRPAGSADGGVLILVPETVLGLSLGDELDAALRRFAIDLARRHQPEHGLLQGRSATPSRPDLRRAASPPSSCRRSRPSRRRAAAWIAAT